MESVDEGEIDLQAQILLSNTDMQSSFDELLRNTTTCTHTHTCNLPGPSMANHTHTCYHTHTQVFATSEGERDDEGEAKKQRKPLGNREAVRKYREKKKAHAAYLEEEVKKLRMVNQQLLKKLQGHAALEAEVVRLRSLLVDVRAKIDGELGAYPFERQSSSNGKVFRCSSDSQCIHETAAVVGWEGGCMPAIINCQSGQNLEVVNSMDVIGSLVSSSSQIE
ncbi:putative transcription factor bZIP family [Dioscorea sansibarensis]